MTTGYTIQDHTSWTTDGESNVAWGLRRDRYWNGDDSQNTILDNKKTPHRYSTWYADLFYGMYRVTDPYDPSRWVYNNILVLWDDAVWTANDDLKLIGRLRDAYDESNGLNGGNLLGELPQTVGLLADNVTRLADALHNARKGKLPTPSRGNGSGKKKQPRRRRKPAKEPTPWIADSWLEFSFGVMPLLSDIHALAKLAWELDERRTRIVARARGAPGKPYVYGNHLSVNGESVIKKQIVAYLKTDFPSFWNKFGLSDPATVAWELLPWSFVADWVVPIGSFIEAQSFAMRAEGTFVTTTHSYRRWNAVAEGLYQGWKPISNSVNDRGKDGTMTRNVSYSLSVPLPGLKSSLLGGKPLNRLANALALISQALK